MSEWRVSAEPALHGYQVEWEEEDELLVSRANRLFRIDSPGLPITPVATLPARRWKEQAARLRPAQRLLRFFYYNVLKLPDGRLFASFDKGVGVTSCGGFRAIEGLVRPCRVLRSGCAL